MSTLEEETEKYLRSLTEAEKKEVKRMLAEFEPLNKLVSCDNIHKK